MWQEQARIAAESLALAQEQERQHHPIEAQRLYARTLIELEASGKSPVDLTDLRQRRAFLLKEVGNIPEALTEFERLADVYEREILSSGYGNVDRNYAELAAWSLNMMGEMLLHDTDRRSEFIRQKLGMVARRLLSMVKYLARRYDSKVQMLLTAAEIHHVLGDNAESLSLFEQADTLFHQKHLGSLVVPDGLSLHLARVRETLGLPMHKRRTSARATPRTGRKKRQ